MCASFSWLVFNSPLFRQIPKYFAQLSDCIFAGFRNSWSHLIAGTVLDNFYIRREHLLFW